MIKSTSHLAILHHSRVPSDVLDGFCDVLSPYDIQRIKRPSDSYHQASLEWLAIPLLAIYLLKPYFNAVLNEAGKYHYSLLKNALLGMWSRIFGRDADLRATIVTSTGKKESEYSMSLAIYYVAKSGRLVKFIFYDKYSQDEYEEHIAKIVDLVDSFHADENTNTNNVFDVDDTNMSSLSVVVYDKENGALRIINDPVAFILNEKRIEKEP